MKHLTFAALAVIFVGCDAAQPAPVAASFGHTKDALGETTCGTTAVNVFSTVISYPAPTTCGGIAATTTSGPSYGSSECPYQFVVEVKPNNNGGTFGPGYYFDDAGTLSFPRSTTQANCVKEWASESAYAYVNGAWTKLWTQTYLGSWTAPSPDVFFPCTWSVSNSGAIVGVPSNATKARMVASHWLESGGTKGTDNLDTYFAVTAGVGAGAPCPPR